MTISEKLFFLPPDLVFDAMRYTSPVVYEEAYAISSTVYQAITTRRCQEGWVSYWSGGGEMKKATALGDGLNPLPVPLRIASQRARLFLFLSGLLGCLFLCRHVVASFERSPLKFYLRP